MTAKETYALVELVVGLANNPNHGMQAYKKEINALLKYLAIESTRAKEYNF